MSELTWSQQVARAEQDRRAPFIALTQEQYDRLEQKDQDQIYIIEMEADDMTKPDPLIEFMAEHASDDEHYSHAELMITLVAYTMWLKDRRYLKGAPTIQQATTDLVQRFLEETT